MKQLKQPKPRKGKKEKLHNVKKVYVYFLETNEIVEFKSRLDVSRKLGMVTSTIYNRVFKQTIDYSKNVYISFNRITDTEKIEIYRQFKEGKMALNPYNRNVYKYNENFELIQKYPTVKDCALNNPDYDSKMISTRLSKNLKAAKKGYLLTYKGVILTCEQLEGKSYKIWTPPKHKDKKMKIEQKHQTTKRYTFKHSEIVVNAIPIKYFDASKYVGYKVKMTYKKLTKNLDLDLVTITDCIKEVAINQNFGLNKICLESGLKISFNSVESIELIDVSLFIANKLSNLFASTDGQTRLIALEYSDALKNGFFPQYPHYDIYVDSEVRRLKSEFKSFSDRQIKTALELLKLLKTLSKLNIDENKKL